jgi:hypothetical protein
MLGAYASRSAGVQISVDPEEPNALASDLDCVAVDWTLSTHGSA